MDEFIGFKSHEAYSFRPLRNSGTKVYAKPQTELILLAVSESAILQKKCHALKQIMKLSFTISILKIFTIRVLLECMHF
jgi:hypothetical protein